MPLKSYHLKANDHKGILIKCSHAIWDITIIHNSFKTNRMIALNKDPNHYYFESFVVMSVNSNYWVSKHFPLSVM